MRREITQHPTAALFHCVRCGQWLGHDLIEIAPPAPEDVRIPAEVREILKGLIDEYFGKEDE